MRIAYLTAGAAGMFCGSCMNDNAVAKAIIQLGHDCLLVPVYTPIRTDDEDVTIDQVFLGGVNIYLQLRLPWLRYLPRSFDSILNRPGLIRWATSNVSRTSPKMLGALTVSMLKGAQGRQNKEFGRMLDWLAVQERPDVLLLTNFLIGGDLPRIKSKLRSKVFVTLQGDDIFLDSLPNKYRSESIQLMKDLVSYVDGFIVHSDFYAQKMSTMLAIPHEKIHRVPLAIPTKDFVDAARFGSSDSDSNSHDASRPYTIGYLARMAPEKGLHQLIDAFIDLGSKPTRSSVGIKLAGWMGPQHREYWSEQQLRLAKAGLSDRVEYVGSVDRQGKLDFLNSIDLFCVPTVYADPKGIFLLEAAAMGCPYVEPNHGAFPELHERLQMGQLFQHDSIESLVTALEVSIDRNDRRKPTSASILEEIDIAEHAMRLLQVFE